MPPTKETDPHRPARNTPQVIAVLVTTTSRRGLIQCTYIVKCPRCSNKRRHNSDGIRQCPCGTHYRVATGATV